jgi:hypothetical protein
MEESNRKKIFLLIRHFKLAFFWPSLWLFIIALNSCNSNRDESLSAIDSDLTSINQSLRAIHDDMRNNP